MDLAEIVEAFKLNIDRLTIERLWEILPLVTSEIKERTRADTLHYLENGREMIVTKAVTYIE
jgi:hypothetical protein